MLGRVFPFLSCWVIFNLIKIWGPNSSPVKFCYWYHVWCCILRCIQNKQKKVDGINVQITFMSNTSGNHKFTPEPLIPFSLHVWMLIKFSWQKAISWNPSRSSHHHRVFVTAGIGTDGFTSTCHVQQWTPLHRTRLCLHAVSLKLVHLIKSHESPQNNNFKNSLSSSAPLNQSQTWQTVWMELGCLQVIKAGWEMRSGEQGSGAVECCRFCHFKVSL